MSEPLRRRVRSRALHALSSVAGSPFDPLLRAMLASASHSLRWTRHARTTRENLQLALGPTMSAPELERVARGVRRHTARLVHEWLWMARASRSPLDRERVERWIDRTVAFDPSVDALERAARERGGVLIVSAHLGNWELLAAALRRRGLDGAVVGFRKRRDSSADWLVQMRAGLGVTSLAQDAPPRSVLRVLQSGATLGLMCDLRAKRLASEIAPFFGRPAPTMSAPAALARASGLPLTPVRCVRVGSGYRLSVDEALDFAHSGDRRADTVDLLTRMNAVFERWIRETPEQWAWHQKRWTPGEGPAS